MSAKQFRDAMRSQYEATLGMLRTSVERCPDAAWKKKVGNWPFWLVAYHVLCFVDLYSAKSNKEWKPHAEFHPRGRRELLDPRPSRAFTREEVLGYCDYVAEQLRESVSRETVKSLAGPTGFHWVPGTRMEHHIYNLRHLAHHTGQLTSALRRVKRNVGWDMGGRAKGK